MPFGGLLVMGIIGAVGAVAGGTIAANASKSAAATQAASGQSALDFQKQQWAQTQANEAPFIKGGQQAFGQLSSMLSPKGSATAGQGTPGTSPYDPATGKTATQPGPGLNLQPTGTGASPGGTTGPFQAQRQAQQQQQTPLSSMAAPTAPTAPGAPGAAGTVKIQAPDGSVANVPAAQMQTAIARGGKVI